MHARHGHYLLAFGCGAALVAFALVFPFLVLGVHHHFTMFEGNRAPLEWRLLWIGIALGTVAILGVAGYFWKQAYLATATHPHRAKLLLCLVALGIVVVLIA